MGHCDDAHMDEGDGGIILAENGRMTIHTMRARAFIVNENSWKGRND